MGIVDVANNLTTIAKLLEEVDYKDDWNEDV